MYSESQKDDNVLEPYTTMKLRSAKKVKMKSDFTSKSKVFNSPLYRGLKFWNSLPSDIQNEKDTTNFKKKLAKHDFGS